MKATHLDQPEAGGYDGHHTDANPLPMTTIELSADERSQLGTTRGDLPYIPDAAAWEAFRAMLVKKSAQRNPGFFDPALSAYTPGETLALLEQPAIRDWLNGVRDLPVPEDCAGIVLVPCAASKPWRNHANTRKSKLYSAYNQLLDEMESGQRPRWFFITVSEPLGLVPQDRWNDFPPYDNPGLFRDDFLRTGLVKTDWARTFLKSRHRLPFDEAAFQACIQKLGSHIGSFLLKQGKPIVSFVDDDVPTTHGAMLDVAEAMGARIRRFPKREQARVNPYPYLDRVLAEQAAEQGSEPTGPPRRRASPR